MKKLQFFVFLVLPLLLIKFACTPVVPASTTTTPPEEIHANNKNCIDESKIEKDKPCTREYKPVCGCNEVTYPNICEAKKAGVTKWSNGACNGCIDKSKISNRGCPENWEPVCGCDGKTYSNECHADVAGVVKYTAGECDKNCINPDNIVNKPCAQIYKPVCGCDGNTYSNECMAKNAGLISWEDGPCSDGCVDRTKITNKPCTMVYKPVCGCNGKTYSNACVAETSGVLRWVDGKCPNDDKPPKCIDPNKISLRPCPDVYKPVCGCDGKTYTNQCNAEINGVLRWEKGACAQEEKCIDRSIITNKGCPENWDPVCGCNNKTYSNICHAKEAGVTRWTEGECNKNCIDPKKVDPDKLCTMVYQPVCGCDGKTYSNACHAERAGVTKWTNGECGN